jgi:CheY-like chemotaxis protein
MFSQVPALPGKVRDGLGIGLSISRALVELHGGTIEARSGGPANGSEFLVRLPIAAPSRDESASRPAPVVRERPLRCRVLVADDNPDAAESLARLLGSGGHEVRIAADGTQALQIAASFLPDAALIDIGMPWVNGYEVARRIRREPWGRDMLLAAVTGWGQNGDRERALEAGFDAHFAKPVEPGAVFALLRSETIPERR